MKISHSILIKAEIKKVWQVTIDVENWCNWTPTIEKSELIDQSFQLGSKSKLKQPGMPEAIWTVTQLQEEKSFSWESSINGLKMKATHELESKSQDSTNNILTIEVTGLLSYLLWPLIKKKMIEALMLENEGLKRFCEK